jgi:antirestriction protein ArdC
MKKDIAAAVTDRIVEAMEKGIVPWRKPWSAGQNAPTSLSTGKTYRGINYMILEMVSGLEGYENNLWGTYRQFQKMGGQVQKGEKGTTIILWKKIEKVDESGEQKSFAMMSTFTVFNIAQTDVEVPAKYIFADRTAVPVLEGIEQAMNYPNGPTVRHLEQDGAYYNWSTDTITLPKVDQFNSANDYANTALHEISHSTGHTSRLNRDLENKFGCDQYAEEELVAEIGSAMLATALNIDVDWNQSAAYLGSWLKVLKSDRSLIITAAKEAQKIIDHVLPQEADMEAAA